MLGHGEIVARAYAASVLALVPTAPGWAEVALADVEALLSDHAHCEKKAAQQAMSLLHAVSAHDEVVLRLARLAEQEAEHLRRVIETIHSLGLHLRPDTTNAYAAALARDANDTIDRLIVAALIEARSHERLELLTVALAARPDLAHLVPMFDELRACEAGHAHTYLQIAALVADERRVQARIPAWVEREASAIAGVEPRSAVH
jgi:tRNA 2-(methylsulfanyl)-N6-isopentenyladenosine37 hydroxylase